VGDGAKLKVRGTKNKRHY